MLKCAQVFFSLKKCSEKVQIKANIRYECFKKTWRAPLYAYFMELSDVKKKMILQHGKVIKCMEQSVLNTRILKCFMTFFGVYV